jgi:hypothetical protein
MIFTLISYAFIVFYFFLLLSHSTREDNPMPVFIDASASIMSLDDLSVQTSFIKNKLNKNIVLATSTSIGSALALHASDGSVYYTNNKGSIVISGDIYDVSTGKSLSEESKAMRYFSGIDMQEDERKVVGDNDDLVTLSDSYADIMRKKLDSISKSESKVEAAPVPAKKSSSALHSSPESHSAMTPYSLAQSYTQIPTGNGLSNESCLITFGGFNQPKIGYDDKCNKLSGSAKKEQIKTMMGGFPEGFFVKHKAENERAEIYVFTDYTCGYCKKLHKQIDAFLKNGVSVNYILYPRAVGAKGNDSQAREVVTNMSSAWCSDNQVEAMDKLYKTGYIPFAECNKKDEKLDSPIRQHYILGMMFGIEGTPLIVGSNGETTYGFRSVGTTLTKLKL